MFVEPYTGMALGQMFALFLFAIYSFVAGFTYHGEEWVQRTYVTLIIATGGVFLTHPLQVHPTAALVILALAAYLGLKLLLFAFRITGLPSRWNHICGDECRAE